MPVTPGDTIPLRGPALLRRPGLGGCHGQERGGGPPGARPPRPRPAARTPHAGPLTPCPRAGARRVPTHPFTETGKALC